MRIINTYIVMCAFFIISSLDIKAQTRREVQFSLDTLLRSHRNLQKDYKSIKLDWKKQNNFFEHVKNLIFDPADVNSSIDDGIALFDKVNNASAEELEELKVSYSKLEDSLRFFKDSISYFDKVIYNLEQENFSYNKILLSLLKKGSFPKSTPEFIGEWDLFLNPVQIHGEPFESGIVGFNSFAPNDSIMLHSIYKIDFSEDEIATLYFVNGKAQKSFYSISDFSTQSPYSIKFIKNEDFKLTLKVSPLPTGLMVSYEAPLKSDSIYYYYGFMRK